MAQTFSPRSILLCVVFLFSTNVLAISAVLGIDLGTEYIKATLVKPGIPLEIVLTKDSRRKETSAVAFKPSQNAPKSGSYPERVYGSDAIALAARFPGDVYPNLKTLLGLPTDDAIVKEYAARHPDLQLEAHKTRGTVAFKSKATAHEEAWLVEELLAMELQSIQRNAEALAGSDSTVRSVVITVPPFYTVEEKRAVELAAELVGLKVLSLISDGLAVGLNYATSRTFPNVNEGGKPEYHMVFDMGAGSAKATVLKFQGRTVKDIGKFNKSVQEVQVMGSGWDRTLGGDALNYLIVDDMISKFVESAAAKRASVTAESVRGHGRAMAKLVKDAERLRHILSANVDTGSSFEGLYDDIDFRYKITRADFEKLAEAHAERVGAAVQKALDIAELDIKQLDSIILHGGASRTPFVQKQLEKVAGADKLRSNVNSDEAAVFGAAFRAAELSPSFRVKEIRISDAAFYPAGMMWTNPQDKPQQQRLWTERSLVGAAPKEVTFTNHEDFSVRFYQQVPSTEGTTVNRETKSFTTKNLTASVASLAEKGCSHTDIHFKVKLRLSPEDGEVEVDKASVECEAEVQEKEGSVMDGVKNLFGFGKNKDQQPLKDGEEAAEDASTTDSTETATTSFDSSTTSTTATSSSASADSPEGSPVPKKKQLVVIPVDYIMEKAGIPSLPKTDLTKAKERIKAFEASDKSRRLREEALNQLEGFTYKVRDLLETESFVAASTPEERAKLEKKARDVSEWLYDDGADASREALKSKLKGLKDLVSPVEKRIEEAQKRPELIKSLKSSLDQTNTFIDTIKGKIAEADAYMSSLSSSSTSTTEASSVTSAPSQAGDFDGLEEEETTTSTTTATVEDSGPVPPVYTLDDLKEITDLSKSVMDWLEEKLAEQEKLPETADPVLLVKDLTEKTKKLEKAGMDLAMKSVKAFDKNKKKNSSSKKSSKTKAKKSATKTGSDGAEPTIEAKDGENYIKFGEDGKGPSMEEIEEMIKRMSKEQQNKDEPRTKHDEL
ncbi:actin-like ATPase domain-containing protein [Annulohypoxylon truncatum]|uniref:actin-like ATPase domain-containing protein n=1 Tax=Annulohypoxylon truncatum TaxID=327061 RepID=UPI002007CC15|nr:actin-like ATPase domain-containing protein [Annulohypoxylon truncatum]KAI1210487.1 actin-like ATPase domain-containing protein [Annulohypoxylon truncatum]